MTVNLCTKDGAITTTSHFLALVETKYNVKVVQWMSDAGGEYKSKAFDSMLKDRGIEILQSIPYTHQQNDRAEQIILMLMEKAESMRLQACLPQSWWEFSVEHATHIYNQTPLCHLNWQTPYQLLNNEKPSVEHLWVFGCGAYVYIPAETRVNTLAPKSKLMIYLSCHHPFANFLNFWNLYTLCVYPLSLNFFPPFTPIKTMRMRLLLKSRDQLPCDWIL